MIKKILKAIIEAFELICELISDYEWIQYLIYILSTILWLMNVILLSTLLISLILK